ncbi:zeta-crystallin [Ilyonectria robusta]|uniref:zeta-crystallin n=1 Tax=Ilyonectria robusta TaxID=1079257 RepID=UPI001E8ED277|nr:zeta-crystallin [Ilyonectria robusta]KAH8655921.1 zeta-crystallin [Ilyonectria robusta]
MKAIVVHEFYGSLDDIRVSDVPPPQPRAGEILIRVVAAGVNFVDILYAQGLHQNNKSLVRPPFTLGLEFAGIVVSSPAASSFKPGDAVFGDCGGSYCEFVAIQENSGSLQKIPASWDFTEAAALGATLPVSYGALVLRGGLKAGETVLVHSAAGGIGAMATQIAVAMGCRVLGTAGAAEKCAYAESLGASKCINYTQGHWWERILEETDGRGVDVVFDPVGLVDRSLKCLAHRGRVLVTGFVGLDGQMEKIAMNRVLLKQATLIGYRYGESLRRDPDERRLMWQELQPLMESGQIRPTVSHCYPGLDSVPQALHDLSNRKISGKAVIRVSEGVTGSSKPRL